MAFPSSSVSIHLMLRILSTFEKVKNDLRMLSASDRGYFSRFLRKDDDRDIIIQCEKDLTYALQRFSVSLNDT